MIRRKYLLCALFVLLFSIVCKGKEINNIDKSNNSNIKIKCDNIIKIDKHQEDNIDTKIRKSTFSKIYELDIFIDGLPAKIKSMSKESVLKRIIRKRGIISKWHYADYDGDGKKEAFAVVGLNPIHGIYYINSDKKVFLMKRETEGEKRIGHLIKKLSDYEDYYSIDGIGFFLVDHNPVGSNWWNHTLIFSVKNGIPYELEISDKLSGFYVRNNVIFTIKHFGASYPLPHHAYMKTRLIYSKKKQQFYFGKYMGEDSGLQGKWAYI